MPAIAFDASLPGLLVVTIPEGATDADYDAYYLRMEGEMARSSRKLALILDATRASSPNAAQRRKQGEWMKSHRARIVETTAGISFVIDSAVLRFALSSIFLIQGMPVPYHVCATVEDAIAWSRAQLLAEATAARRAAH